MERRTGRPERGLPPAAALFSALAAAWILLRVLPLSGSVPPTVRAAVDAVRVTTPPTSGRFEVEDGSTAGDESRALDRLPEAAAARARLETEIGAVNGDLALVADRVGGRIELFPEEGVTGLRVSGLIAPFYDNDAGRLAAVRTSGRERPVEALTNVAEILDARLSEPETTLGPEEAVRRRELTRISRDAREALEQGEQRTRAAVDRFREEMFAAAWGAGGPFHRRGPLRIVEILLAALLAATLRAAIPRRRPADTPPLALSLSVAAAAATAGVLLLEGTELLPVDPVTGTALRFVPLAAVLGFLAAAGLEREWTGGVGPEPAQEPSRAVEPEAPSVDVPREPVPPADAPREAMPPTDPDRESVPSPPESLAAAERAPATPAAPTAPDAPAGPPPSERELPDAPLPPLPPSRPAQLPGDRLPFFRRRSRR